MALMSDVEEDPVEMSEDGDEVVQGVDGCLDDEVLENANLGMILEHRAYHDVHNRTLDVAAEGIIVGNEIVILLEEYGQIHKVNGAVGLNGVEG